MDTAPPNHAFISSEHVEGTTVHDRNGTSIGRVDHLTIDKVLGGFVYAWLVLVVFLALAAVTILCLGLN